MLGTNREQLNKIITDTDDTMVAFQKTLKNHRRASATKSSKRDLKDTIGGMPQVSNETRNTIGGMQKTLALADDDLPRHADGDQGLDEQGEGMVSDIDHKVWRGSTSY